MRDGAGASAEAALQEFLRSLSGGVFGWSNRLKERIAVSEKTTVDIDGVWEIAPAFVAQCLGIAERSSLRSPDPHVCIRRSGPRSGIWEIRTAFVSIPCLHAACAVRLFRLMSPPSRGKVFMLPIIPNKGHKINELTV